MKSRQWWVFLLLVVGALSATAVGCSSRTGDQRLSALADATSAANATTSSTTTTPTTTVAPLGTTEVDPSPANSDQIWELAVFDGSITLEGSVSEGWKQASMSWVEDDEGWFHLAIDGTPKYASVDAYCIDGEVCDWLLRFMRSGDHIVWTIENGLGTSEVLHHAISDDDTLGACWSSDHDAPVIATVGFDAAGQKERTNRAWVAPDWQSEGSWIGVSPEAVDPNDVLILPFAGYELPECSTMGPADAGAVEESTPANTKATTTTVQMPPSVEIYCPDDFGYPYGTTGEVTFGYRYLLGSAGDAEFDIDYGDGGTYHSSDAAHAERNLFWHDYELPGFFTAEVRMMADNGMQASDSCSFTYEWTTPPPADSWSLNPGTSGGGLPTRGFDAQACTFDGIPLWGKVQIVDYLADVKVEVVDYLPDLRVQVKDYLATSCGEWQIVDYLADFKIQLVDYLPDIKIQTVGYLPGS